MDQTKFPLPPTMRALLEKVRAARNFDPADWTERKCTMLNDYFRTCGLKGIVLNCSGGIDSSVTLALCKHASQMPDSPITTILCLAQPIHSTVSIQNKAYVICKHLGVDIVTLDQTAVFDQVAKLVQDATHLPAATFADGQLRSYMRTPTAYYAAQLLNASGTPSLVMGTGNFDEDGYILYYCKAGDGVVDLSLISDLHKAEVYRVGAYLKLPAEILAAVPSADLWLGQTDEDELGFSYAFVELYTEILLLPQDKQQQLLAELSPDDKKVFDRWAECAARVHRRNSHKRFLPKTLPVFAYMDRILEV